MATRRKPLPAETAEVGDYVTVTRERGTFRIMAWHHEGPSDPECFFTAGRNCLNCQTPAGSFSAFGPISGMSGNLKRAGGHRAFLVDRIVKVVQKGEEEG